MLLATLDAAVSALLLFAVSTVKGKPMKKIKLKKNNQQRIIQQEKHLIAVSAYQKNLYLHYLIKQIPFSAKLDLH
jgi:hypothetical protein